MWKNQWAQWSSSTVRPKYSMGANLMRPMYSMSPSFVAWCPSLVGMIEAVMSGTPTGSGMHVQPPGIQFGNPWINDTMGPVSFVAIIFAVCAWISETLGLMKGIGIPFSVALP